MSDASVLNASDEFKKQCDTLYLTQLINTPTRPNTEWSENSSLIKIILINASPQYSPIGVFAYDVNDHCVIVAFKDTKIPKSKPFLVEK